MSQKYEDYANRMKEKMSKAYPFSNEVVPMFSERDNELYREIRDRAIISLVTKAVKTGKELSYGDIRLLIDDDPTEKQYEESKTKTGITR